MSGFERINRSGADPNTISADVDQLMSNIDSMNKGATSTPSGTTVLVQSSDRTQTFLLSSDRIAKINGTGILTGERFDLTFKGDFFGIVQAGDASIITTIPKGRVIVQALIDTPLTNTDWITIYAEGGWMPITPTGDWIVNTVYSGYARRIGESGEFIAKLLLTGAPSGSMSSIDFGINFQSSVKNLNDGAHGPCHRINLRQNATSNNDGSVFTPTSGSSSVIIRSGVQNQINTTVPFSWNTNDGLVLQVSYPVSGWELF